ncbi:MAG: cache domain-containing protein, partial [Bacilli bacterium]
MRIKPLLERLFDVVFNQSKLKPKLIISYLVASFLPLLLTGVFLVQKANQIIEDQTNRTLGVSMQQVNYNMDTQLSSYEELANHFYFDTALNIDLQEDYSESSNLDAIVVEQAFIERVKVLLKFKNDLRAISLYFYNPSLYNAKPYLTLADKDIMVNSDFQHAMASSYKGYWGQTKKVKEGSLYWEANVKHNATTTWVFSYSRALEFYNAKEPVGLLTLEIKESELFQLLSKESRDNHIFLVGTSGDIITSNDRDRLGTALEPEVFHRISQQSTGEFLWDQNSDHFKVMYSELKNGWKMVYMIPVNRLLEETRNMRNYGLLFILASMILSVVLIIIV